MRRSFTAISFAVFLSAAALCQAPPVFEIADVHVSPRDTWVKTTVNAMHPAILSAGRYEIRRATMLDLIRTAYSVDADKIFGGPSWLDYDRFDVIAKTLPKTKPADLRLMLQSLLADRFNLIVRADSKPVPAYLLSVAKGGPKLKPAEGSASPGCESLPTIVVDPFGHRNALLHIRCSSVTLTTLAATLRSFGGFSNGVPVVDATGIEGLWDIDLQYSGRSPTTTVGEVLESIGKQLGLTLELKQAPQPVLSVESVNEQPTPNSDNVAASLPPLPSPEFEVASIKPCDGTGPSIYLRFQPGGRVTARCVPLISLITAAWKLPPLEELAGAPKWLSDREPFFSIEAKAPAGNFTDATGAEDRDALNAMMRALLVDRFRMKFHYEDRPRDTYTLVAVKPKLTKADPTGRTGCRWEDSSGRGPNLRPLVCRNITMTQFAEQIQAHEYHLAFPVLDGTGIDGAWDFTVNYRISMEGLPLFAGRGGGEPGQASDPAVLPTFAEALPRQLGLKLDPHKRPQRVMVIDHIEEKPTAN